MGKVFIKKRISFDFLGDDYKDCEAFFTPIPLSEYKEIIAQQEADTKEGTSIEFIIKKVEDHFISGTFLDEKGEKFDLSKDNIKEFDLECILQIFGLLTGRVVDPKLLNV